MLSCKEVTDKLSADIDRELPLLDRLSVRLHQFICKDCRHAGMNIRALVDSCLLYTSPSPRDQRGSRMPSSA